MRCSCPCERAHRCHSLGGLSADPVLIQGVLGFEAQRPPLPMPSPSFLGPRPGPTPHPGPGLAGTALRAAASASPCPALSRRRASWRRPTGCGKRRSARGCSFSSSCWPRPRRPCSSSSGTRRGPSGAHCWARRGTRPPRAGPGTGTTSRCVPAPVPGRLRPRGIGVGRGGRGRARAGRAERGQVLVLSLVTSFWKRARPS